VKCIGAVNDEQKNTLLGEAAAFRADRLGRTVRHHMAEAMACGTPIIGFRRGSVPDIVREGINGYAVRTVDEAAAAVQKIDRISRAVRAD
jgi:glycosyltransferase involved in cell wall biosynthesis